MGVEVIIQNKNSEGKELSIHDILLPGMMFGSMDDSYRLKENVVSQVMVVFNSEHLCRGHEVEIQNGTITLSLSLPTSRKDINYFYRHVKFICQMFKTDKFIRDGNEMTIENINSCIEFDSSTSLGALRKMREQIDSGEYLNMTLFGVLHPVSFGKEEIDQIGDDIDNLGEIMNDFYMQDIFYPTTLMFYDKEKKPMGVVAIPEDVLTAFPKDPNPFGSKIKLNYAYVAFNVNGKILGCISFDDFIANVDKSRKFDHDRFIISLNITEINELLKKYKKEI